MTFSATLIVIALLATTALATTDLAPTELAATGQAGPQPGAPGTAAPEPGRVEPQGEARREERTRTLMVGDPAPALMVSEWVRGEAIADGPGLPAGRVYVIEFWATWCGPCRRSMALLNRLQTSHADSQLAVIGLSGGDAQGETLTKVKGFLSRQAEPPGYRIAFDDAARTRAAWLGAARIVQIPAAFVVAADGRIAWIGNPAKAGPALEAAVQQLLDGSFDWGKAIADAKLSLARRGEVEAEGAALQSRLRAAMQAGDIDATIECAGMLVRLDSERYGRMGLVKFEALLNDKRQPAAAFAYARELLSDRLRDDPIALASLAWEILEASPARDLDLALAAATRAAELAGGEDATVLDTLARALFEKGRLDAAIDAQERAVRRAPEGQVAERMKRTLERYQASKRR